MTWWDKLTEKGPSVIDLGGAEKFDYMANTVGSLGLALIFFLSTVLTVIMAFKVYPPTLLRRLTTLIFALFLFFAGMSRLFDGIAYWNNYVMIRGLLKLITISIFLLDIPFIPQVIRQVSKFKEIMQLQEDLKHTREKLEEVKKIGNKLTND